METLIAVGIIAFLVFVVLQIVYMIFMIRLSLSIRDFMRTSDAKITPVLLELHDTLQEVRKAADDASAVAGNVREITETVTILKRSVQGLYDKYRGELNEAAKNQVAGLKAGLKAGMSSLVKNLSREKGEPG